jgi:hypothetical protein
MIMNATSKKYDVFISHASEDKDSLVRPLAMLLEQLSVRVWYDEFSLKLGDSLSASIDKGLRDSRYGLVVLSKAFLGKRWTDYEYRSLLTRQVGGESVLLPLWYGIDTEDVKSYSLYLADVKALSISRDNLNVVVPAILRVIRPDIWQEMRMRSALRKLIAESTYAAVDLSEIDGATSKHSKLTPQQIVRSKAVFYGIGKHLHSSFKDYIDNYELDVVPERELQTWEIMNACYLEMLDRHPDATEGNREDFFKILLAFSVGGRLESETRLSSSEIKELGTLWKGNLYDF